MAAVFILLGAVIGAAIGVVGNWVAKPAWKERTKVLVLVVLVAVGALVAVVADAVGGASDHLATPSQADGQTSSQATTTPSTPVTTTTAATSPPTPSWVVLHPFDDFEMDSKSCSDGDAGSFNIDEFAPNYQMGTLEFDDCGDAVLGLTLGRKGKYLNKAPTTQPSPEDCESEARRSSRSKFPVEDIVAGQSAFCVVSGKGNVAWILVASKASKVLGLKVIVWSHS